MSGYIPDDFWSIVIMHIESKEEVPSHGEEKIAVLMAGAMIFSNFAIPVSGAETAENDSFCLEEFQDPGMEYRPGVRWWWPGGAVEEETLKKKLTIWQKRALVM